MSSNIIMSKSDSKNSTSQLKVEKIITKMEEDFSERAWDVIMRRFGVIQSEQETLESIGRSYGITRERVRQIESESLEELRSEDYQELLSPFYSELELFLTDHGGLMREDYISARFINHIEEKEHRKGFVDLLLELEEKFQFRREDEHLHSLWHTQEESLKQARNFLDEVRDFFEKEEILLHRDEFQTHLKKNYPYFSEKALFTYLECSKKVGANVFDEFGLKDWSEVSPRGVRDKAYLVTKKHGDPLHFREITDHINEVGFSEREAKPQTVHNELIKDERFVLVGRGTYALRDWGYEPGTVKEVIKKVLKEREEPVHQEDIIEAVLDQRLVKEGTIKFNLKANEEFEEVEEKHYTLNE